MLIGFGTNTAKSHLSLAFAEAIVLKLFSEIKIIAGDNATEIITDGLSEFLQQTLANFTSKKVL